VPTTADQSDGLRDNLRGMHGVRAYSADPEQSAGLLGDVLGMDPKGDGTWLARGKRRHSVLIYDEAPEKPGRVGAEGLGGSLVYRTSEPPTERCTTSRL